MEIDGKKRANHIEDLVFSKWDFGTHILLSVISVFSIFYCRLWVLSPSGFRKQNYVRLDILMTFGTVGKTHAECSWNLEHNMIVAEGPKQ